MDLPRNPFKQALAEGRLQIGLWSALASHIVADIIADAGFDWILLDTEHAPNEIAGLLPQLQAMSRGTATPIVRPAWNDAVLIKRIMDLGVHTLLVPWVQSAAEARRRSRPPATRLRGCAAARSASARAGMAASPITCSGPMRRSACWCRRKPGKRDQLEAIAAVEGVDGVFIGPSDLAASLGHTGNPAHPDVQEAIEDAARRLEAVGKAAGILTSDEQAARRYIGWGFTFVAVGSDGGLLARSADALAKAFKAG